MKKSIWPEQRVARGPVNLLTPTGRHETGNFQRFLLEGPDINRMLNELD